MCVSHKWVYKSSAPGAEYVQSFHLHLMPSSCAGSLMGVARSRTSGSSSSRSSGSGGEVRESAVTAELGVRGSTLDAESDADEPAGVCRY